MKSPNIYIAGKFGERARLRHERDRIHREGLGRVISSWLDLTRDAETPEDNAAEGQRDLKEVLLSNLFILDTDGQTRRGGRENEFGIALGAGVEAWVVGPRRSVFHCIVPQFYSWDDVLNGLWKKKLSL